MAKNRNRSNVGMGSSLGRNTDFNPDYTHVKRDLGRIGILAGSFFVILIALSFFIK